MWTISAGNAGQGVAFAAREAGIASTVVAIETAPKSFTQVMESDVQAFKRFFHAMLDAGVYLPPSAFEAAFTSAAGAPSPNI